MNQPLKSLDFYLLGEIFWVARGGWESKFVVWKKEKKKSLVCVSFGNGSSEAVDKVRTRLPLPRSTQAGFHAVHGGLGPERKGRQRGICLAELRVHAACIFVDITADFPSSKSTSKHPLLLFSFSPSLVLITKVLIKAFGEPRRGGKKYTNKKQTCLL